MIIAVCNGKGGTGKTTVATLLALAYQSSSKLTVGLLDLDPQKTATQWVTVTESPIAIAEAGQNFDVLVIDTPPRLETPEMRDAIKRADKVVLVTSTSPADVFTSLTTADTIKRDGAEAKARILFNKVKPRTRLGRDLDDLAERIGLPAFKTHLHDRQAYQHAILEGWAALPPDTQAEIYALAMEISTL